jgi:hypothetical protein
MSDFQSYWSNGRSGLILVTLLKYFLGLEVEGGNFYLQRKYDMLEETNMKQDLVVLNIKRLPDKRVPNYDPGRNNVVATK